MSDVPMPLDVHFRGLTAPLRLTEAEGLLPLIAQIARGWPHVVQSASDISQPFFTIMADPGTSLFRCTSHVDGRPVQTLDAVNAICDVMAALALALPAEDDRVLCLHAAGVDIGGRVVVFPNVRRAGKSTLAAALAQDGFRVFSDDVLPLSFPGGKVALVQSMGIAPRLRLPLPESLPGAFRDWATADPGPANRQYKYLTRPDGPPRGESMPLGAFVILDRQDAPVAARLTPVPADAAMDALLHQHFTRDRHSGDVLEVMATILSGLQVWQLTYSDLADAVACLRAAFGAWPGPGDGPPAAVRFRMADFALKLPPPAHALAQRPDTTARVIGEGLYVADPEGRAIHRLDPLAAAIWEVLEVPTTADEIGEMLAEAFPDIDPARLRRDVKSLLSQLVAAGLIG